MRGLPPLPTDVIHLVQDIDINRRQVSIGFWLYAPENDGATPDELNAIIADWFNFGIGPLLACMHSGASFTTCRLTAKGATSIESAPDNHGGWTGGLPDNVAMGFAWNTGQPGRRQWALTYLPAVPDVFVSDNWRVSTVGWGNLIASSRDLLNALQSLTSPSGVKQVPGTVHRRTVAGPLPASEFAQYLGVSPTPKVVTIRRRIPRRNSVSSL